MVFRFDDYRALIQEALKLGKLTRPGLTAQKLAEAAGIQKAYLSKVLNAKADFNTDQLFLISKFFGWRADQADYVLLLLEFERTALEERKQLLKKRIDQIQQQHLKISSNLAASSASPPEEKFAEFYLDPWAQIIFAYLSIPEYSRNISRISQRLGISDQTLEEALQVLLDLKIIGKKNGAFEILAKQLHIEKGSSLFKVWQSQIRLLGLQRLQFRPQESDYNLNVVFSADVQTRKKIQSEFLSFLKRMEKYVGEAKEREVYHMSFDLFEWA